MLFNSYEFVIFLVFLFIIYYLPFFRKKQIFILIIASFIFYAFNNAALLLLLLVSIIINSTSSYLIVYGNQRYKKFWAVSGVVLNLLILFIFKYSPLIARTFISRNEQGFLYDFLVTIPLPIGISFFTFQGISLVVDVFRDKPEKSGDHSKLVSGSIVNHFTNIAFYKSFFPQLIAGPIVKAHDFLFQIGYKEKKNINIELVFKRLVLGYFLKVVIADNLKEHTVFMIYPYFSDLPTGSLLILLYGYSIQIFADFAGYSFIALGLAGLFGYELPENFNFPYLSGSFSEFWKRWHISLSSWLKEYLYIPLGGSRKGGARTYLNLMIVMFLGGLWHGAAWSYAIWGSFHGLLLVLERFFRGGWKLKQTLPLQILKTIIVFSCVSFAWLLFKLPDFDQVILFVKAFINNSYKHFYFVKFNIYILLYSLPVIFYYITHILLKYQTRNFILRNEYLIYAGMLFLIITNPGFQGEFIYFQF